MKIAYLCGSHVGALGILLLKDKIETIICYKQECKNLCDLLEIKYNHTVKDINFSNNDIILSVSGREIVTQNMIKATRLGIGLNVHPYLYAYKGSDPIGRAIKDQNWKASVGVHHMTDILDSGEVLFELGKEIQPSTTRDEVYSQIYDLYCKVIIMTIRHVGNFYNT